ncbi:MAG: hypothetical protein JO040_00805 [Gemmatimonadetes bacterium]|nr:hypothetical protein [Gemmatimonadota bacterium]
MQRKWMKRATMPVLALVLALWSCDSTGGRELQAVTGPRENIVGSVLGSVGRYRLVGASGVSTGSVTAVIGSQGGTLQLGEHELAVPAGAVTAPTVFTLRVDDGEHIRVDLTATRTLATGEVVDVGARGFGRPLRLKLGFARASDSFDPNQLRIVWARPDGTLEVLATEVNPSGKQLRADLQHFSGYAVAVPRVVDDVVDYIF